MRDELFPFRCRRSNDDGMDRFINVEFYAPEKKEEEEKKCVCSLLFLSCALCAPSAAVFLLLLLLRINSIGGAKRPIENGI